MLYNLGLDFKPWSDYRQADGKTQFARADVKSYDRVDVVGRY